MYWFFFVFIGAATAFLAQRPYRAQPHLVAKVNQNNQPDEAEEERFGVSYIGQDVCGSKYNDDPFGEQKDKPDAWALMKMRIRAEEIKLANATRTTLFDDKTKHPGQWP